MRKEKKDINLFAIILGVSTLVALIMFLFLNVAVYEYQDIGIQGYKSIFGISTINNLKFKYVNGIGLTIFILLILDALISGILGSYKRGFYIVSLIINLILIYFMFTYHSTWVLLNISNTTMRIFKIGAGQIVSGIIMCLHGILNLVAFNLAKDNKR